MTTFLRCSQRAGNRHAVRACAPVAGSPLDSPRGEEIGALYQNLFGDTDRARAARSQLTGSTAEAVAARRELAVLLSQLRLLGLEETTYARLRDQLLTDLAGEDGREALLDAVRAEARGVPL